MKKTTISRIVAGIASLVISVSIFGFVMTDAQATNANVVKYQKVEYDEFSNLIGKKEAPVCTYTDESSGYLFAGWYEDETGKTPIRENKDINTAVYAKFVPARLTGIACQTRANVEVTDTTKLRIVSAVDSGNYSKVGFNVYGRKYNEESQTYENWVMYEYDNIEVRQAESEKVYSGLQVYEYKNNEFIKTGIKYPADVFGVDAEGFKFTTMSLSGITRDNYSTIVAIKPYWITLDGTYVEGMGEYNRVQDGIDDIVNISVNLKTASDIAAGKLNVKYDAVNFKYEGIEYGRVFEEMQFEGPIFSNNVGTVKCVGHVANVSKNAANPNDIFVNLRFSKINELEKGTSVFEIVLSETNDVVCFCNRKEEPVTDVDVWDVYY